VFFKNPEKFFVLTLSFQANCSLIQLKMSRSHKR
jgi:hypothetical protein